MDKEPVGICDTILRDAHQSLLATRMRSIDMISVSSRASSDLSSRSIRTASTRLAAIVSSLESHVLPPSPRLGA